MKKKLLSLFACLTCCIFIASPICAAAALPELIVLLAETAFSDFIGRSAETDEEGNRKGFVGALRDYQNLLPEGALFNPIIANDDISFRVPNYYVVTGKMHIMGDFKFYGSDNEVTSTVPTDQTIECTFLCMDDAYTWSDYKSTIALTKESDGGKYLFGNALNFRVTDSLGNESNFVMSCTENLYNKVQVLNDRITISTAHYDVYMYSGDTLTQEIYDNQWNRGLRFNNATVNTIDRDVQSLANPPTQGDYFGNDASGYLEYSYTQGSPRNQLTIFDIVQGRAELAYKRKATSSNTNWMTSHVYPLDYLFSGFVVTNNNVSERTIQNNWTNLSTQNYYIDNIFEGDTIIDKTNYNDWGGGALAPVFELPDVDLPSLPLADILDILTDLLPDIKAGLQPSIDIGMDSLFDRLFDFYSQMPDIGFEWSPDLDNYNYFEVDLPDLPDSGGGGSGSVWVPPEYEPVNTSVYIPAVVPSYSTYAAVTVPSSVIVGSRNFFQTGWIFLDDLGLVVIIIPVAIVALLWKFTGGD